ncbi:VOC family protein [Salipaludibacillus sp. HK11]|uniref:VOC family protein n=1 Tax=Salipaludibacillus sp. HK11 TaxID=3394320 RepID=UPI0039FCEEA6
MAIQKIHHIGVMVSDMEASITFYREVIGLELFKRLNLENVPPLAFLGFPNAKETTVELVEVKGANFAEEGRVHHLAFGVADIEAEVERLKDLNVSFVNENVNTMSNGSKNIFFYGPDRERIELFEELN